MRLSLADFRRVFALSSADKRLVLECVTAVLRERFAPTARRRALSRLMHRDPGTRGPDPLLCRHIVVAVARFDRLLPGEPNCLVQALASLRVLHAHGQDAVLRIGVRRDGGIAPLAAHAWLEQDGRVLLGDLPDLESYLPLVGSEDSPVSWECRSTELCSIVDRAAMGAAPLSGNRE